MPTCRRRKIIEEDTPSTTTIQRGLASDQWIVFEPRLQGATVCRIAVAGTVRFLREIERITLPRIIHQVISGPLSRARYLSGALVQLGPANRLLLK